MDQMLAWIGAAVVGSIGVLAVLFIWYWIVEYALRLFKLKKLILQYYWDRMKRNQPRVTTRKSDIRP